MAAPDPTAPPSAGEAREQSPLASIHAYSRTGCAIVTIERAGRAPHPHRVSLGRYASLREWAITRAARRWRTCGAWLRGSTAVSLWAPEEAWVRASRLYCLRQPCGA